jgi:hypothetical protein
MAHSWLSASSSFQFISSNLKCIIEAQIGGIFVSRFHSNHRAHKNLHYLRLFIFNDTFPPPHAIPSARRVFFFEARRSSAEKLMLDDDCISRKHPEEKIV